MMLAYIICGPGLTSSCLHHVISQADFLSWIFISGVFMTTQANMRSKILRLGEIVSRDFAAIMAMVFTIAGVVLVRLKFCGSANFLWLIAQEKGVGLPESALCGGE